MNTSNGGPHILLFERDQQLAALLMSEMQLAGYETHTARTAVEVFDAIARQPIRLVLVNLAQAAAARREFWVALDTQRRGRGIQVLTFRCLNLASYGPHDPDDRSQTTVADVEVDGMIGLMSLVDAVRERVPLAGTMATTMPRLPRITTPPPTSNTYASSPKPQQPLPPPLGNSVLLSTNGSATSYRTTLTNENGLSQIIARNNSTPLPPPPVSPQNSPVVPPQPVSPLRATPAASSGMPGTNQASYTEKIRAVLYPEQRNWNAQGNISYQTPPTAPPAPMMPESRTETPSYPAAHNAAPTYAPAPAPSDSALQRLASGQIDAGKESGLAQLSRLVQEHRSSLVDEPGTITHSTNPYSAEPPEARPLFSEMMTERPSSNTGSMSYMRPTGESLSTQPLRASPIQDMPGERAAGGQGNSEVTRRPDVLSRANYGPQAQQPTPTAIPPLASIATPMPSAPAAIPNISGNASTASTMSAPAKQPAPVQTRVPHIVTPVQPTPAPPAASPSSAPVQPTPVPPSTSAPVPPSASAPASSFTSASAQASQASSAPVQPAPAPPSASPPVQSSPVLSTSVQEEISAEARRQEAIAALIMKGPFGDRKEHGSALLGQEESGHFSAAQLEASTAPNNAMLLDIVQSLPPMPALSPQSSAVQPQVLSGRAMRTLGNVLLEGHLVPESRLEVAQNIQRMLRGVDLNYQLGEILLMFKLLTPDQLLAASLVSYGLITTEQVSALGRIRQELHSIGLEYDLENLLILFRILTPEQLREVKTSWQS